jgi:hypothetical protein
MTKQRVTVAEAAERLGISPEAVRMRIRRNQLEGDKERGRVYVLLDTDPTVDQTQPDTTALISAKDETIATLQEQLEQANERDRENRRIIAALTSRIPELSAPPPEEPSEAPETSRAQPGRVGHQTPIEAPESWWENVRDQQPEAEESRPAPRDAQEPDTRERQVPWWRRMFGG